jgi:chromosome segregation ATPase
MKRVFIVLGFCAIGQAQSSSSDSAVIQALLSEVHQLRIALERANTIGPRIQLAIERIRIQQENVARLTREWEEAQRNVTKVSSERESYLTTIKEIESQLNRATDPALRKRFEDDMPRMQSRFTQAERSELNARAQEAELNSRLKAEQATLYGLTDRLNQIERALDETSKQ